MRYDFIILGSGAAGLSLAYRMALDPYFDDKSIAIIDKTSKVFNDRTWCFWEERNGMFEDIIHKKWSSLKFYSTDVALDLDIAPYQYKMIKGIDFYVHTLNLLRAKKNFSVIEEEVTEINEMSGFVTVSTSKNNYESHRVFKSFPSVDSKKIASGIYVDQHFKGMFIETSTPVFDEDKAVFMDFRIPQNGEVRFLYVLPSSPYKALVEVAIFSTEHLEMKDYDDILYQYIETYICPKDYKVEEEEYGVIPMTTYPFWKHNTDRIFHIGTGGGIVKPSSGYAFGRIQQHSEQLIEAIKNDKPLSSSYNGLHGRYTFYDKIMLNAILRGWTDGKQVFTKLFQKKKASAVLKFLDQKNTHLEDFSIFTAPPTWPFFRSMIDVLIRKK